MSNAFAVWILYAAALIGCCFALCRANCRLHRLSIGLLWGAATLSAAYAVLIAQAPRSSPPVAIVQVVGQGWGIPISGIGRPDE